MNKYSKEEAQKEWVGMPEFIQKTQRPHAQIVVRFETEEDLQEFAVLIGQALTQKTKSIWFPYKSHWGNNSKKKYYDES